MPTWYRSRNQLKVFSSFHLPIRGMAGGLTPSPAGMFTCSPRGISPFISSFSPCSPALNRKIDPASDGENVRERSVRRTKKEQGCKKKKKNTKAQATGRILASSEGKKGTDLEAGLGIVALDLDSSLQSSPSSPTSSFLPTSLINSKNAEQVFQNQTKPSFVLPSLSHPAPRIERLS